MSTPETQSNTGTPAVKKGKMPLLVLLLAVLITCGNAGFWFWKSRHTAPATATTAEKSEAQACTKQPDPQDMQRVAMEPFVVNLGQGGEQYLRASLTLAIPKDPKAKEETDKNAAATLYAPARDTILDVLSRQEAAALLTPEGKASLKAGIISALKTDHPELHIVDIYFTDFLVQV